MTLGGCGVVTDNTWVREGFNRGDFLTKFVKFENLKKKLKFFFLNLSNMPLICAALPKIMS